MSESLELPIDPFSSETAPIPEPEEIRRDTGSSILELPKNQGRFSQTSQAILEELRVRHRRLEMHGSAEITPSLLLSVDSISEILLKEVQLPEIHKTPAAVSEAILELSDVENHFQSRAVYFYPYLLRTEGSITIRIVMVAPQNKDKTDIVPYRRACFKYSEDLLGMVYKNLANKNPVLDEISPGKVLMTRDAKGEPEFNPNLFSVENDLRLITNQGFSPYTSIPIPDFIFDAIQFGRSRQLLFVVSPNYHIVITSSGFVENLLKHLIVQIDALASFVFHKLKSIAKETEHFRYIDLIEDLESRIPESRAALLEGGWKIAYEFVTLLKDFPFDEKTLNQNLKLKDTCLESIAILEKLLAEIKKKGRDVHQEKYVEILKKVKEKIVENTLRNLVLTPVDVELELTPLFSVLKTEKSDFVGKFIDELSSMLPVYPLKDETGKIICYSLDQRYLQDTYENTERLATKDSKYVRELSYLNTLRKELLARNDSQLDLLSESVSHTVEKVSPSVEPGEIENKVLDLDRLQSRFHIPSAVLISAAGSMFVTVYALIFNQLEQLIGGVFLSILFGVTVSYFINKILTAPKEKSQVKRNSNPASFEQSLSLLRAAESVLFPKKFNNVFEKVYDPKKLRYRLEEKLEEIRNLLPPTERKKDEAKLIGEIEHAIMQIVAHIKIPEEVQMKGKAREFIVSKNDLKTLLFRDKLSEHFRKEASIYKSDPDMMAYLNFIIKEIEFGYTKYTKS
jgi:hypothetical protein